MTSFLHEICRSENTLHVRHQRIISQRNKLERHRGTIEETCTVAATAHGLTVIILRLMQGGDFNERRS